jgi:hypothetical protein
MAGSGSAIFPDAIDYCTRLPGSSDFLLITPAPFQARLAWIDLRRVQLMRAQETAARVRYVCLPAERAFVTFPIHRDTTLICGGFELSPGDIVFHAHGERFHERTAGPARWGSVSMRVETLSLFARTLTGNELAPPPAGLIIRPKPADRQRMLQIHARAVRIAETKIGLVGHPEVSRALEEDLIWALLTCLTADSRQDVRVVELREPIMVQFEDVLAAFRDRIPGVTEISDAIGTPQSVLQSCCLRVLGMNPARYLHLRRLTMVQSLLVRARLAVGVSASDLSRQHGFADTSFRHRISTRVR